MTITSQEQYEETVAALTDAAKAYYSETTDGGVTPYSDEEYDLLIDALKEYEAAHPDLNVQHSLYSVAAGFGSGSVKHRIPMLSLDKEKSLPAVEAFIRTQLDAGRTVLLEPKYDGIALSATFSDGKLIRAVTRGDGETGEDLTEKLIYLQGRGQLVTPSRLDGEIRGELLVSLADFTKANETRAHKITLLEQELADKLGSQEPGGHSPATIRKHYNARINSLQPYANPRNIVAGVLKAKIIQPTSPEGTPSPDPDVTLTLVPHDHTTLATATATADVPGFMEHITRFGATRRQTYPYPTDGVVITIPEQDRDYTDVTSRAPRWAKAYKFDPEKALTVLRDIKMGVGKTGNISFTAIVDPVIVDGSEVSRATLHNYAFIQDNDLRIGDTVEIFKANDVIPRIVKPILEKRPTDSVPYTVEPVCPITGTPLDTTNAIWRSTAPEASVGAWLAFAVSRTALDIDGLGEKLTAYLIQTDAVADFADLFTLTINDLANLPLVEDDGEGGYKPRTTTSGDPILLGQTTAKELHKNITQARQQPLSRFITALSIKSVGTVFSRRLAKHIPNLAALQNPNLPLPNIDGFAETRMKAFRAGLKTRHNTITKLVTLGINPTQETPTQTNSNIANKTFVITGTITGPLHNLTRQQVQTLIENMGGKTSNTVSTKTDYLVASQTGTSKHRKAEQLGIPIITPEQLARMLNK